MSWRLRYTPIIAKVIRENQGKSLSELRKLLRAAFPDVPREHHPYKIWLSECAYQLGIKVPSKRRENANRRPAKEQKDLFP